MCVCVCVYAGLIAGTLKVFRMVGGVAVYGDFNLLYRQRMRFGYEGVMS